MTAIADLRRPGPRSAPGLFVLSVRRGRHGGVDVEFEYSEEMEDQMLPSQIQSDIARRPQDCALHAFAQPMPSIRKLDDEALARTTQASGEV